MNRTMKVLSVALVLSLNLVLSPIAGAESAAERNQRMAWWREARFGMFVHWGLYSGLAGTWKEQAVGQHGGMEWIQQRVKADTWEYAHEAVPHFRPAEGFADQWAKLARAAGCRYVVFTTKHHDGFALFESDVTTYDARDLVGRDLCDEIVKACRAESLKVGFYHSVIDWHHPQYNYDAANQLPHPLRGQPSPNGRRHHQLYVDYLHRQAEELMTNYGAVDIIWWDYSKKGNDGPFWRADQLMGMVRKNQPAIISNNRLYHITSPADSSHADRLKSWNPEQGDFTTPEQHIPATGVAGVDWEVCMTLNTTWGYSEHDQAWKSDETLIRNLIDIVSKGGNYLLNIGPKGDGSVPDKSIQSMQAIGHWMSLNGESIYGTSASLFPKLPWGRSTTKGRTIYLHVFEWPEDAKLLIPGLRSDVQSARILATEEALQVQRTDEGVVLSLPATAPDPVASVIALELDEAPRVED